TICLSDWSSDVCSSDLVPRFEVLLSRREFLLDFLDQVVLSGRNRRQQPDIVAPRRIQYRQGRKFHGSLLCVRVLWPRSQRRNVRSEERRVGEAGRVLWR